MTTTKGRKANMKTISIINLKGGTGKSTTAITMAHILSGAKHKKRVLLIDNDKQGNTSQFFNKASLAGCGSGDILRKIQPTIYRITDTLDLINANMTLEGAEYEVLAATDNQADRFASFLQTVADQYDFCIIDNPPSVSMCVVNALCASDEVIVTVKLNDWSLDGVDILTEQINNLKAINSRLKVAGVLLTIFKRTIFSEAAEEWLRLNSPHKVFETKIRYSDKVDDWTYSKVPLEKFSKMCAASVDYRKFIREYLGEK